MLIAAFILVISTAAMIQFAVFGWRASLLRTIATQPLVEQATVVAGAPSNLLNGKDFSEVTAFQGLCPDLKADSGKLRSVRMYYRLLRLANQLGDLIVAPGAEGFGGWTQREMALCTSYTAVVLSHRLARNQALAAEARSY